MATIRLIPSTYYLSNTQYLSVSNASNMYNNTDNTTYATVTNSRNRTSNYYIYLRGFNFDDIPAGATINSFTIKLKCNYNGGYSQVAYLYDGENTSYGSSNTSISSTVSTYTFNPTKSWEDIVASGSDFGIRINCRRNSQNQTAYMYIYGAEIEVDYTPLVTYDISTSVQTDKVTSVSPASTQSVSEGNDFELRINTSYTTDDFKVEDNGINVTDQVIAHYPGSSGNESTVLGEYTLVSGSFNGSGASYFQGLVGNGVNSIQTTSNYYSGGSGTIAVFTYKLEFSNIPSNAVITNLYVQVNGHAESDSSSSEYMCVQLITGSTELSDEFNFKSAGTSNTTQTINATTLPTVAQLSDLKLQCRLGYYGGAINGATAYIEYEVPSSTSDPDYYIYTIENVTADHTIVISDSIIEIPEEDPTKTYYPITISGINCTTTPSKGTNRVEAGTSQTITIYPTESQVTLITDNGIDVSSQLVQHGGGTGTYTVNSVSGASYGFNLNSSTGYYTSTNAGVDSSASVCRVVFNLPVRSLITIKYLFYISDGEDNYDYGIFGNIDTSIGTTNSTDSDTIFLNLQNQSSSNEQTLTYEIPAGEHYIEIKYRKDTSYNYDNDNLQFKIDSIQELETNNYYTYTLSNINQEHSLIFIFGNVTYYFVNSSVNGDAILYPNGSMVTLPGDNYKLTILPKVADGTLSVTDNNTDVTNSIVTKTITKDRVTTTNYIYSLSNIQATHNIVVNYTTQSSYNIRQVVNSSDISISPSGNQEVDAGTNYSVNITVTKPGTITVNDSISGDTEYDVTVSDVSGGSKTVTHTLTNVRADKTLTFDFEELDKYNVTVSENSTYLSIPTGYGTQNNIYHGQPCTVKFTSTIPGTITINDNGTSTNHTVTSSNLTVTHTISSVTANHTISATFAIATYSVSASKGSDSADITLNPSTAQTINHGNSYSLTITPSVPGSLVIKEESTTVQSWTIPVGDLSAKTFTLSSVTAAHTYTVTLTELTKYNVTASENSSYLSIPSGYTSQSIYSGQSCDVKFTATVPGTLTVTDNSTSTNYTVTSENQTITHTISSVTAAHTVSATFAIKTYSVSISQASGSSSVTLNPSTTQTIDYNGSYSVNITPSVPGTLTVKEGSTTIQTWTIAVGQQGTAKTLSVSNIKADHTYSVTLTELAKYNVTASENSNYLSILSGYTSQSIYSGQSCDVKFTATVPGTLTVSDNGTNTNYTISSENQTITYTISSVTAAHTVSATFAIATYNISASVKSGSSSVTLNPSTTQTVNYGGSYSLSVTPSVPGTLTISEGNTTVQTWTIPVGNLSAKTYSINNVSAAHTYTVNLTELAKYTVTSSENSSYLSIPSAQLSQTVYSGQPVSVEITSTIPGTIVVSDNGTTTRYTVTSSNLKATHTISSVTAAHTISVTFDIPTYAVSTTLASGSKSVTINPSGSQDIEHGATYSVSLTPSVPGTMTVKEGSTVKETWTIPVGDLSVKTFSVSNITAAHTYTVTLTELTKYTVTESEDSTYLSIPSGYASQSIYSGQSCTVKYTLSAPGVITITDNGTSTNYTVSSANQTISHTISSVTAAHTVSATFTLASYSISTSLASGSKSVTINPSTAQTINYGSTYSVILTPSVPGTLTVKEGNTTVQTWTIPVGDLSAKTFSVSNIAAAHTYTVTLTELTKYTVTETEDSTYLSIPSGYASQSIYSGQSCTVKFTSTTPGTISINDNGTTTNYTVTASNLTATHTISSVTAAHTVSATFTIASYTITMSKASGSSDVTINPASTSINHGSSYSVTLTPSVPGTMVIKEGSTTKETWTIPVGNLAAKTFTVSNITAAHTYIVTLAELTKYNVSVTNNASNVTVTPSTTQSIYSGQNAVIQLKTTKAGTISIKDSVSGDTSTLTYTESELNTNKSYTLTNVTAAHTLTITFADKTYQVSVSEDSEYLTITSTTPSTIVSKGTYQVKATVSIPGTVTLKQGTTTLNTQTVSSANGTYSYNVTNIVENKTLTLEFTPTQFTVTAQTSSSDITIVSGATYTGIYGTTYTLQYKCSTISTVTINKDGSSTSVVIGPSDINKTKTYTTTVTGNHEITLSNSLTTYDITGSISSGGTYIKFVDGTTDKTTISKTVNAATSYTVYVKSTMPGKLTVTINGTATSVTLPQTYTYPYIYSQTIDNILEDKTVTLGFDVLKYNIDTESGTTPVIYNQPYTYKFTPAYAGTYTLYDNDSLVQTYTISASQVGTEQSYTISHVTSAHSFSVTSDIQKYTVSVTNSAQKYIADYSVSKSNPAYHESSTINITPRVKGTINISDNGTNSSITTDGSIKTYTISNIEDNHDIILSFTPGTYTVTITNNIPSNYDLTLSKAAGNHNVTACENFTLILTVNSGSKDTMNGKINISSTAGNASYGVVMDTPMSRTYTINEILQNITITLSFEESDMAPIVGDKFLKAFETRPKQQEYVAENNTNPLISFITTTSEVDYTSHYGDMRYVNTEYRDGNADNLFKR